MNKSYDVIVVGLGAVGSAALYQLSKRGKRVLGIDQFSPPHRFGSSHGDTRVTRLAIGEGKFYTPFAIRSHLIWRELERRTGLELLNTIGGLVMASQSSHYSLHGNTDFLGETVNAAVEHGITHRVLNTEDIRKEFPQFNLIGDEAGYYEPTMGFLRPESCIRAQLILARQNGAKILTENKVLGIIPRHDGVKIESWRGSFIADKVIISVGAWINNFLSPEYSDLFKVYRQVLYWFDVSNSYDRFREGVFPVFVWKGTDGFIYGFPAIDGPNGGLKVASEEFNMVSDPDNIDRKISEEEIGKMYDYTSRFLPEIRKNCVKAIACLYTKTSDSNFVIDYLDAFPDIIIASPCSGHGFKHSAAVGETLAEMATSSGRTTLDISPFSLKRFT